MVVDIEAFADPASGLSSSIILPSSILTSFAHKVFKRLLDTERLPDEAMRGLADDALVRIVQHARDTVPFYKDRLGKVVSSGKPDHEAWLAVALLSRGDVGNCHAELQSVADMEPYGEIREISAGRGILWLVVLGNRAFAPLGGYRVSAMRLNLSLTAWAHDSLQLDRLSSSQVRSTT